MKELSELDLPGDRSYTEDHEWAMEVGKKVKIGISDYAQDQLGDIVFIEMPEEGDTFSQGDEFGTLESVKAVSELYIPLSGKVIAVNEDLEDQPELLNEDPNKHWIITIEPSDLSEMEELLSSATYLDMLRD